MGHMHQKDGYGIIYSRRNIDVEMNVWYDSLIYGQERRQAYVQRGRNDLCIGQSDGKTYGVVWARKKTIIETYLSKHNG